MTEFKVAVNYAEELSGCSNDCKEVAVEKAHSEENKYLTETTTKSNVDTVAEETWVIHDTSVSVFPMVEYFVQIKAQTHDGSEAIISKHGWISKVSFA